MQLWEKYLEGLRTELGAETVDKWLKPLKVVNFDACNLFLEADRFQLIWFEEHLRKKVLAEFKNNNNKSIRVHVKIPSQVAIEKTSRPKSKVEIVPKLSIQYEELNPLCTFENYVSTESDLLAYKVLCQACGIDETTGKPSDHIQLDLGSFNPIYLYGIKGSGKTHLLQAATNALRNRGLRAIYASADKFTDHVVTAIRASEMSHFRQAYRNVDALIIDDVHIFSRKAATQEEFFHTFNALQLEGKQIILSSSVAPSELHLIEPRLVSRFEWGIVLPLAVYTKDELKKILNQKATSLNFYLHPKLIDFFLETFASNCRYLIRALEALILRTHQTDKMMTVPMAKQILADLIEEEAHNTLTPEKIFKVVAEQFGIKAEDLFGKAQNRDIVLPRQIAMHLCRTELKLPYMKIGELFSKDHSTVMAGVKGIQKSLDNDVTEVAGHWYFIFKKLKS